MRFRTLSALWVSVGQKSWRKNFCFSTVLMMQIGQSFGIVFGLEVVGAVFQTKALEYVSFILSDLLPSEIRAAIAGTSSAVFDNFFSATRALVVQAISRAIDKVYVLVIAISALTVILALFLPVSNHVKLDVRASVFFSSIISLINWKNFLEKQTICADAQLNR